MRVDVVSDFVCPWCFIGARRLAAACGRMRSTQQPPADIRWHAFLLNPQTAPAGEPYVPFMVRKFGSREAVAALHDRATEAGRSEGIEFRFDDMLVRPSTIAAHDLVARLQEQGEDASELVFKIFEAHFLCGLNIGSADVLTALAVECGFDLRPALEASRSAQRVGALTAFARRTGTAGVPLFVFDRRRALAGAQSVDLLCRTMLDAARDGDG